MPFAKPYKFPRPAKFVGLLASMWLGAIACSSHSVSPVVAAGVSVEPEGSSGNPLDAIVLVQIGWIREIESADPSPYRYSETRYDAEGHPHERVILRRDGSTKEVAEFIDGRVYRWISFEADAHTPELVKRFIHDEAGKLREVRYCSTTNPRCAAWRVETIESWTEDGRPLTGSGRAHGEHGQSTWVYDAAGRVIEKRVGVTIWTYDYDDRGRLVRWDASSPGDDEGDRREYEYDADGRVIREVWRGGWVPTLAIVDYAYEGLAAMPPEITITGVQGAIPIH